MYRSSKYSAAKSSEIRFTIMTALDELASFNGVDLNTIKSTPPFSLALEGVTTQKMAAEIKKLIDSGMIVKGIVRGRTVRYMMRTTYNELLKSGKITERSFGYGDYRDDVIDEPNDNDEDDDVDDDGSDDYTDGVCDRLRLNPSKQYPDMW